MRKIILLCLFFLYGLRVSAMDLSAESACLIVGKTGEVVYSENESTKMKMASTTKIMTALLATESGKMGEVASVSKTAESQEGSSIYLRAGEKIVLRDLVYGLMLNSGNDAAIAIAEHVSGSVEAFSEDMTERAKEIGAENTSFKNPNGLDEDGHYTTAYDLAIIAAEAMKNDEFAEIVSTKSKTAKTENGSVLYFTNHNKLLKLYDGAVGVKTGFTKASGRCLVSAAERDGILLVAVTLNAPDDWNDHKKMLDYGFSKVSLVPVVREGDVLRSEDGYTYISSKNVNIPEVSDNRYDVRLHLPEKFPVPVDKGEKVGYGEVILKGRCVENFDILSGNAVREKRKEKRFLACFIRVFEKII